MAHCPVCGVTDYGAGSGHHCSKRRLAEIDKAEEDADEASADEEPTLDERLADGFKKLTDEGAR